MEEREGGRGGQGEEGTVQAGHRSGAEERQTDGARASERASEREREREGGGRKSCISPRIHHARARYIYSFIRILSMIRRIRRICRK